LEYSRTGRRGAPFQPVDMQSVLVQAKANLEAAICQNEAQIEVGPLPTVSGDQTQLVQLMQNLIDNALKFRRQEPPRIRVSSQSDDGGWQFAVEDNGIGVEAEHFDRIFQTFQRLHGREYPGTGIGLAICKKIVARHNGRIWLTSAFGEGATFYFTLPKSPDTALPTGA
jgi:light-regulated signal transduction histidine kinase (bacteriophytochrome)